MFASFAGGPITAINGGYEVSALTRPDVKKALGIIASSPTNAVGFSSVCATKHFPPRCSPAL
ncbi:MAG: hypothetical protein DMG62_24525 [Acidobacteria bacterium]|nr:MAG: hypothetical protein DMG62_24525 [Acidobacteriota bacterium]